MRVQLNRPDGHPDEGAVAIIVAICLVVLLGISAFAVDFGMAYTNKRQLQTAADAAAIAAASTYADEEGDCTTLSADPDLADEARIAAEALMAENHVTATEVTADFDVRCSANGGVEVQWTNEAATATGLGGVFGASGINADRTAIASLEVPTAVVSGMRPYAICSDDFPGGSLPSDIIKVSFPVASLSSSGCPGADNPGNWWTVNCPEDGSGSSNSVLVENTLNGCEDEVAVVPNQPDPDPAPPNDALHDHLVDVGCAGGADEDCLNAVTGEISGDGIWDAWRVLMCGGVPSSPPPSPCTTGGDEIILPMFCGEEVCDPAAVVNAGGNNADYPVYRLVGVTVCGYDWGQGPAKKRGTKTNGDCTGNTFTVRNGNGDLDADGNADGIVENYLLLRFNTIQISGSTVPSDCALADATCDGGLRQVFLTG